MRRASLVLAAVVVAVGGTLIYLGTRGQTHRQVERLPHLPTTSLSVLLPEGTWTFGSGPAGFAVGRMHITGGPARRHGVMPDSPLAGYVDVRRAGDAAVLEKVTVDATGGFRIDLPVGNYELVGHSANVGEEIDSRSFTINVGQSTPVDLLVQAT